MITADRIRKLAPRCDPDIAQGIEDNAHLLARHDIDTPLRIAHFMAQVAHESDGFKTTREYASGEAYEGRRDLGNSEPGDGRRFRGRGLIQLTGRYNYRQASEALGRNLVGHPESAERFPAALEVSCWFWSSNGLNELADTDDVLAVTRRINGGTNGLKDRKRYLAVAKRIWMGGKTKNETLRKGMAGPDVRRLQEQLDIAVDGIFGPATERAVMDWQGTHGLKADGIVEPKTRASFDAKPKPKPNGIFATIARFIRGLFR